MPELNAAFRRVVITGLGAVTPLGSDLDSSAGALAAGSPGASAGGAPARRPLSGPSLKVPGFDPRPFFSMPKAIKLADRKAQLAVAAAVMAFDDAGLERAPREQERMGIAMGAGNVDLQVQDLAMAIGPDSESRPAVDLPYFARQILSNLNPLWLLVSLPNMISAHVSIQLQALGPNTTLMTDWVAGAQAVGEAWLWIRSGEADCVLAGGADSGLSPLDLLSWSQLQSDCPPFEGCLPGEGSAVLVLEERQRALDRRAPIYGEIAAYSTACAPGVRSRQSVLMRCMSQALRDSGWAPGEVDLVCTAAAGAGVARELEIRDIRQLLGRCQASLPTVEFKSRMGHLLAACAPAEMAMLLHDRRSAGPSARVLCNAAGSQGQGACLAIEMPGAMAGFEGSQKLPRAEP